MIQKFTTKRDRNGNRYTLEIDHDKRRFYPAINSSFSYSDHVTITKRDRQKLMDQAENAGYCVTIRL